MIRWPHEIEEDVAETFMLVTDISPNQVYFSGPDMSRPELQLDAADTVLRFQGFPRITLPSIIDIKKNIGTSDLLDVIRRRRSSRNFTSDPVPLEKFAAICWGCSGISGSAQISGREVSLRTVPSAGARYPCNIHVIVRSVEELEGGVYYYDPLDHCVIRHRQDISSTVFHDIFLGQKVAVSSNLVIVITTSVSRSRHKYGERGYRYALLEAGHIGQNISLLAEYFGLSACGIGGYCDQTLQSECGISRNSERIVYPICVGFPQE